MSSPILKLFWHFYTGRSKGPHFAEKISLTLDGLVVYRKNEIAGLQVGFLRRPSRMDADDEDATVGFICVHAQPGPLRQAGSP